MFKCHDWEQLFGSVLNIDLAANNLIVFLPPKILVCWKAALWIGSRILMQAIECPLYTPPYKVVFYLGSNMVKAVYI